ncbi:hypothetical protein TNCV_581401 [Trichonephila clavipes]|nr:hypothetical protein TNCV_581401 [Trichonephila clavipes]
MIRPLSNSLNCEKCLLARLPGMLRLPKSSYNRWQLSTYSITLTYANPELRDFQISSIRLFPPSPLPIIETQAESVTEPDEVGTVTEEVVDFARQIRLEVDSDDVQELLDSHNHELMTDELVEMHKQARH